MFGEVESAFLVPPPEVQFEVCDWVCGRAADLDLRVVSDKNRYSVPFRRVGAKADLRVTANAVEAYVGGSRVASYPRPPSFVQYRCQTDPARMPPRFVSPEWDEGRILGWAREIGPATLEVVARAFGAVRVPERAGNPSPAILNLTRRYAEAELGTRARMRFPRPKAPGASSEGRCRPATPQAATTPATSRPLAATFAAKVAATTARGLGNGGCGDEAQSP